YKNTFESIPATLSSPRKDHAAAVLKDGRVLIAGGSNGGAPLDSIDIFNPATGLVSRAGRMSVARWGLSATTLVEGAVLVAGGSGNAASSTETAGYATVETHRTDYTPGMHAYVSGVGWHPGEDVSLRFVETDGPDPDDTRTTQADSDGNISYNDFQLDDHD